MMETYQLRFHSWSNVTDEVQPRKYGQLFGALPYRSPALVADCSPSNNIDLLCLHNLTVIFVRNS